MAVLRNVALALMMVPALLQSPPEATAKETAPLYGTLKKIKETGEMVIGYNEYSFPFSFGPETNPSGYSIEICQKISDNIKQFMKDKYGVDVKVIYKSEPIPDERVRKVHKHDFDIECGATTNTLKRQELVDFSYTTFVTGMKLLVKKGSEIKEIEDLNGKVIAVPKKSTNFKQLLEIKNSLALQFDVCGVENHDEGFRLLDDAETGGRCPDVKIPGVVEAYATDEVLLEGLIEKNGRRKKYEIVGRFLSYELYGLMVRRDDSAFRLIANRTLAEIFRSGQIGDLYGKWFVERGMKPAGPLMKSNRILHAIPE
jgi:glutamate/aspartate transport system substrate-binding protein